MTPSNYIHAKTGPEVTWRGMTVQNFRVVVDAEDILRRTLERIYIRCNIHVLLDASTLGLISRYSHPLSVYNVVPCESMYLFRYSIIPRRGILDIIYQESRLHHSTYVLVIGRHVYNGSIQPGTTQHSNGPRAMYRKEESNSRGKGRFFRHEWIDSTLMDVPDFYNSAHRPYT